MKSKIEEVIEQYSVLTETVVKEKTSEILENKVNSNKRKEVYTTIFSCIDLTSLSTSDTEEGIAQFTEKVNKFGEEHPQFPNVAAICVYPSMVKTVRDTLTEGVGIAAVTAGFPHSQTFIEVKIAETSLAVHDGASEIDIVFPIGKLLEKRYDEIVDEINEIKEACHGSILKVILESGALDVRDLQIAAILAMESGADFIKTSTGKQQPAATPEAAWCMCKMIAEYYKITGRKVGFKAAGGISTADDAIKYYSIVKELLGEEWLNNGLFRFGASKLANNILSEIVGDSIKYF